MAFQKSRQCISYLEEIANGEPVYFSSNCLPIKELKFEPAGHAFHSAALKLMGCFESNKARDESQADDNNSEQECANTFDSYSDKGKEKSCTGENQQDHYAFLGLSHLRYLATEDHIRKAYREAALRHHPDKQTALLLAEETEASKQAKRNEIESHFKAIQEAYELLIDPVRRRVYDSTDEFDDEIPTDCAPHEFFKVFGPAFLRNGRWSVTQPVPSLGDDKTPLDDVDKFYNFWYNFKSWREFPHADEFELEQAESRDHKRWMERQNAKLSEKARKEESARIRTLVDNAYKRDPRILRRKEEEKAEKKRKKEAKILAKKLHKETARIAEEEKQKEDEEAKRAAEAALQQKKLKEKEKKLLRKERSCLRSLLAPVLAEHFLDISDADVEGVCTSLNLEQLRALCSKMEGKNGMERAALLKEALGCNQERKAKKQDEKNSQKNGSVVAARKSEKQDGENSQQNGAPVRHLPFSSNQKREKAWSREEIELLRKAMQKYPKGTSRRWEVISEYIGTERSVEEILKATKTVLLQKPDASKAFDSFLEKRKPAPSIDSPLSTREEEGLPNSHMLKDTKFNNLENFSSQKVNCQKSAYTKSVNEVSSMNEVSSSSDQDMWSAVQEKALVQALKTFPKETGQRWDRVAAAVPGKSVNQCKKKFLLLKENFRSKKSSA